jgi:hypothetical protein
MVAQNRHHIPIHTKALDQLYALMRDGNVPMRARLDSAIRASRVEPLEMPGTEAPPAVLFLRNVMTYKYEGKQYNGVLRSKAGAALAYYERRSAMAALKYNVADDSERIEGWRRVINGLLRRHLVKHRRWPQDKDALLGPDEPFAAPPYAPELGLSALLIANPRGRHRAKSVDEPESQVIRSQGERDTVLRAIAHVMHNRLAQFGQAA